jgi:hypothetical protein
VPLCDRRVFFGDTVLLERNTGEMGDQTLLERPRSDPASAYGMGIRYDPAPNETLRLRSPVRHSSAPRRSSLPDQRRAEHGQLLATSTGLVSAGARSSAGCIPESVASDSALEEDGFELSVPRQMGNGSRLRPSGRIDRRAAMSSKQLPPSASDRDVGWPFEVNPHAPNQAAPPGRAVGGANVSRNLKFESISLQRRVCKPSVPRKR